jgi:hypothetical protein
MVILGREKVFRRALVLLAHNSRFIVLVARFTAMWFGEIAERPSLMKARPVPTIDFPLMSKISGEMIATS